MTLNVGFIGFGKSTTVFHLPYLQIRDNLKVKKIYSRTKKTEMEEPYKKDGIEFVYDLQELLADESISLITICTSDETHYDFAKACLEHGKHVLVEKPFSFTGEEARELLRLAASRNLIIMPYQNRRFDSDFLAVQQALESGKLGDPVEIESHFDYYRPEAPDSPESSRYKGAVYGLGVHLIDQAVSLFGKPEKMYYDIRSVRNPGNPDDYFHIELFYSGFKYILKMSHLVKEPYPKFLIQGTSGTFIKYGIDQQEDHLRKLGKKPGEEGFGEDPEASYGKLIYMENGMEKTDILPTPLGDYGKIYDLLYDSIVHGKPKPVSNKEIETVIEIMERGVNGANPKVLTFTVEDEGIS
ncbi:oxidoreductase [Bacillus mangrovi]|uniref:Oxidoreductase n=1 Tax=Metabacillus mangrovi TaxID=1491830 RepID=A0A7X2V631_9BACI|nr:oxidoreductase [Metabacillus mangrovi]MTH54673.1 oxidoreductase [Metabacillus mangrovi]